MRNPDRFSSLVLFAGGMMTALWSLKYGFGSLSEPGVGFITFFAGAILALLSLLLFFSSFREKEKPVALRELWAGLDVKKVIYVLVLLIAYTVLLRPVGFPLCTFILLFLLFRVKGSYGIWTPLFVSFFVTAVSYLVFQVWLQVQLPRGILG
jgi:putative tricarboxylic transport membrane protein